ncbi:hypothetical protein ACWU4D_15705 [Vibrio sp. WJH972]
MPPVNRYRPRSSYGVALLEVVVSLMLLSLVVVGLIQVEQGLLVKFEHGQYKMKAANHIDNYFESLRTRGANSEISEAAVIDFDTGIGSKTISYPDGIELESKVIELLVAGNVKKVEATGRWQLSSGETGSISATTMIAKYSEFY